MKLQQPIHEYYEQLAPDYDQDRFGNTYGQYIHRQETAILKQLLPYPPNAPTLDLGCGTGRLLPYATHGLDYSAAMIAEARTKFPQHAFEVGSAWDTPYPNQSFDTVYSFHVLTYSQIKSKPYLKKRLVSLSQEGGSFSIFLPKSAGN